MTPKQKAKAKRDAILYNLLPGDREKIAAHQGGKDPITGEPLRPGFNIDHDHKTGLIRGALNPMTNKRLVDDVSVLRRTIAYLLQPPATAALGEPVYGLIGRAKATKRRKRYGPDGTAEPVQRTLALR